MSLVLNDISIWIIFEVDQNFVAIWNFRSKFEIFRVCSEWISDPKKETLPRPILNQRIKIIRSTYRLIWSELSKQMWNMDLMFSELSFQGLWLRVSFPILSQQCSIETASLVWIQLSMPAWTVDSYGSWWKPM